MSEAGATRPRGSRVAVSPLRGARLAGVLGAVERDVGAVEEVGASVVGRSSATPAERADRADLVDRARRDRADDPLGEELGVGARRLRAG